MALLPILQYPDRRLHTLAKPVAQVDTRVRKIVADMFETLREANGIGLAATQVDIHEQIIVIEFTGDEADTVLQSHVLINPQIMQKSAAQKDHEEGCLSVPGFYGKVKRPDSVVVEALNAEGRTFQLEADGLLSVVIQHEMDHLQGKVFVQYLSELKRLRIRQKLLKKQREG